MLGLVHTLVSSHEDYFLKEKFEALVKFKEFQTLMKNNSKNLKIQIFHSNN
jgi:hypothetical protein